MLNALLSRRRKREPTRTETTGVIEQFSKNKVVGWLMDAHHQNPDASKFAVACNGKNWIENITFFHRPGLEHFKQDNLFGFKITLRKGIKNTTDASLFYFCENDFFTLPMTKGKESLLPVTGSKAAFQNQVYALAVQQGVGILQPALIGKALSKPLEHEHSRSVSEFLLSAGIKSKGGVAITGKYSHLFLYGGSNKVDQLFAPEASLDPRLFDRWEKVVLKRAKLLQDRDCDFVQMIIPEKQSVLPECYHRDITDISPLLASLEAAQLPGWFSALDALRGSDPKALFFKTDSHLNSRGCWQLFSAFLEHQGLSSLPEPSFDREKKICGDLGKKFAPYTFHETDWSPRCFPVETNPELFKSSVPAGKGHIGRLYHWKNSAPVDPQKVLIFGNSFFEKGRYPHQLTWWFAHYFSEVMFIWSPDINKGMVKKFSPDIVIGQSIERFARLAPNH